MKKAMQKEGNEVGRKEDEEGKACDHALHL